MSCGDGRVLRAYKAAQAFDGSVFNEGTKYQITLERLEVFGDCGEDAAVSFNIFDDSFTRFSMYSRGVSVQYAAKEIFPDHFVYPKMGSRKKHLKAGN